MKKADLKHFKGLIIKKREELYKQLDYLSKNSEKTAKDQAGDSSSFSNHGEEQAADADEREKAFAEAERENRFLHHLNEALGRIKKGTYGKCRSCEEEIPKKRLEAVPHATQCVKCKNAEEKKKRGR